MNHENMKMTEVGWIPKDWEVKTLEQLFNSYSTASFSRDQMNADNVVYCVHYGDIHTKYGHVVKLGKNVTPMISTQQAGHFMRLNDGDVILADASEDYEGVGKAIVVLTEGKTAISGLHTILLRKKDENVFFTTFPSYMFAGRIVKQQIEQLSEGTKINSISFKKIKNVLAIYPKFPSEQRRIAQVLSDTDSLIASLSRTIEKKRLVKQGAMQQLLTGKTRLKGFSGEWVEKIIGNIGKTYNGITGKTKADFGCGNARYITFLNVLNNPIIDTNILEKVNINFDEGQNEVRRGDLFFNTSSEIPEEVGICATLKQNVEEVYLNSFCFGFRLSDEEIDNQYLAYYFRSEQGRALMTMLAQGATRYNLSKDNFNKSCIVLPPTKDEQQAIANILTTMDNEIASLEAELQKYKALKQGMMQKLLTGQIRLKVCQDTNA